MLDIGMIGPKGAGKTSLLAAMYYEVGSSLDTSRVTLVPQDSDGSHTTAQYLNAAVNDLQNISRGLFDIPEGIPPNTLGRTLEFVLKSRETGRVFTRLRWTDYPGELLFPPVPGTGSKDENTQELKKRLHASRAVLVAVDAPALMWNSGRLHLPINRPYEVQSILSEWLEEAGSTKLVLICPIKCEKWVQTEPERIRLEAATREAFDAFVAEVRSREKGRPKVLYMPVQTVGSLRHSTFKEVGANEFRSVFVGTPTGQFSPLWVSDPLKAVLMDAAKHVDDTESLIDWLFDRNKAVKRQRKAWLEEGLGETVVQWV